MAQIFLSYASVDRERVLPLVEALQDDGFAVWWDRDIHAGPSFDREIEQAIDAAGCMVVVWSSHSVESEWVRSEVEEGVRRGILVPVMIESVMPPLAYRRRQSANLSEWQGEHCSEYNKLLTGIRATIEATVTAETAIGFVVPVSKSASLRPKPRRQKVAFRAATFAVALAVVLSVISTWYISDRLVEKTLIEPIDVLRFEIGLPTGVAIPRNIHSRANITANGQAVTYITRNNSGEMTYMLRKLDSFESQAIPLNSSQLGSHWLTPDNTSLVFNDVALNTYRKASLDGGQSTSITETGSANVRGLSFSPDGQLAIASGSAGISILAATGDLLTQLTNTDADQVHSDPLLTSNGKALLFTQTSAGIQTVKILNRDSGEIKLLTAGQRPQLTTSGHLVVLRSGALWAAPFDSKSLSITGEPILVLEGVDSISPSYDISDNGTLIYVSGVSGRGQELGLVWAGLDGQVQPISIAVERMGLPRLSPNGEQVLFHAVRELEDSRNIWNHSLLKGTTTKLTFNQSPILGVAPAWDHKGASYVYLKAYGSGKSDLFLGLANGAGEPLQLTQGGIAGSPSIGPDNRTVIFLQCSNRDNCDIAKINVDGDDYSLVLETPFRERSPEISPDGKWLAYTSDESGMFEVYVRPFPAINSAKWQVSKGGGEVPLWTPDGTQLLFVERATNQLMSAAVSGTERFNWAPAEPILDVSPFVWNNGPRNTRNFDISKDGERFLMVRESDESQRIMVIVNWLEEVKRLVPIGP